MKNAFHFLYIFRAFFANALTLLVLLVVLIVLGASDATLQLAGSVLGELPLFGPWFGAIASFTRDTVSAALGSTMVYAMLLLLQCLAANILDSLLIGVINAFLARLLPGISFLKGGPVDLIGAICSAIIGLLLLWPMKAFLSTAGYAITVFAVEIGLMLLGFSLILGKFGGRSRTQRRASALVYLIEVLIAAAETGALVGLLSSALLLVPLVRSGVPFWGFLLWMLCLLAMAAVFAGLLLAKRRMDAASRFGFF